MLVLTRKKNEPIILELPTGEIIKVILCEINGNTVRVGIDAPKDVAIIREELVRLRLSSLSV